MIFKECCEFGEHMILEKFRIKLYFFNENVNKSEHNKEAIFSFRNGKLTKYLVIKVMVSFKSNLAIGSCFKKGKKFAGYNFAVPAIKWTFDFND